MKFYLLLINKMEDYSISICGYGYVGSAMGSLCEKNNVKFNVYDLVQKNGKFNYFNNIESVVNYAESCSNIHYVIVAVPTPSDSMGNCDISIIKSILSRLNILKTKETYVIIKSTIVPGTSKKLNEEYPELNIVFCPEFLTEKNYLSDIYNAKFIILGISLKFDMIKYQKILKLMRTFYKHNSQIEIFMKSYEEAELFKYTINNFLAIKVWYFNKIYDISESLGINYEFDLEPRISGYGTRCPGDHGRGYAGSCLIKDQNGLIKLLENLDIDNSVLKTISNENKEMRKK